jgi:ATP/maltotriose-dependent transcriptional regulator MalT
MARRLPTVVDGMLRHTDRPDDPGMGVSAPEWWVWLDAPTTRAFAFREGVTTFTARKERRQRGSTYWTAYRKVRGKLASAYLGKSTDLTLDRLRAVAARLAAPVYHAPAPAGGTDPGEMQPPAPPSESRAHPAATAAPITLLAGTLTIPLLETKLSGPRVRPHIVARARLVERLNAGLHHALMLIAAPAGFGKTTALAEWIAQHAYRVAWVCLDAGDNDPTRFWTYVIAALQRLHPNIGATALALLQSPQPPNESFLTLLLNEIATCLGEPWPSAHPSAGQPPSAAVPAARLGTGGAGAAGFALILDDYQVIRTPAIHAGMTFLLDNLPAPMHVIIASRADPILPLARWRARGQLTELRADDLRFTAAEAATFLNHTMGLDLSAEQIATLEIRTEGWIAGLQLAALAIQDRADATEFIAAFTGSNRFVVDYLSSEVLDRLPEQLRTFVLRTSILERMCGELCDAVLGTMNDERGTMKGPARAEFDPSFIVHRSSLTLEELERANLFVMPLDDERRWYRYHHLFAGVLRERLARSTTVAEVAELHQRASAWFERQGLAAEAIHHALAGHDFVRAAALIEPIVIPLAMEGQQATVRRWLADLPDDLRRVRPRLVLAYAWVADFNSDFAAAEAHLREAEAAAQSWDADQAALRIEVDALRAVAGSILGDRHATDLGQIVFAQLDRNHPLYSTLAAGLSYAAFAAGDLAAANHMLQDALASRPIQHTPSAIYASLVALLAMVRRAEGRLHEARRLALEALDATTRDGRTLPVSGAFLAYLLLGLAQCEQNELDAAEHTLRQCAALARQYQVTMYELLAQFYLGQILGARGDLAGALRMVEQAEAQAGHYLSLLNLREFVGYRVLLWLRQGDLAGASAWAAQDARTTDPDRPRFTSYDIDRFALARTRMAEGRWDAAHTAVVELLDAAEAAGHGRFVIWALALQALILHAVGESTAAIKSLERALVLAAPEDYVHVFVDEGAPMAALLWEAAARGVMPEYIARLLAIFPQTTNDEGKTMKAEAADHRSSLIVQPLVEPLSARELEILGLLADGLTNQAIAQRLYLAVGTVKVHLKHIYGKLDVSRRTQAVARARELNLV